MADYYVDNQNGSNEDDGSEGSPWETIAYANSQISAGDTVYIKEGTGVYAEQIYPGVTGTSGNIITYKNYDSNVPRIAGTGSNAAPVYLGSRDYITIEGLTIGYAAQSSSAPAKGISLDGSDHIIIKDCEIQYGQTGTYSRGIADRYGGTACTYVEIDGCTIHDWGTKGTPPTYPDDNGEGVKFHTGADYIYIHDCTFSNCGHALIDIFANHLIIKDNTFSNDDWNKCVSFYLNETTNYSLVEGNVIKLADNLESTYPNAGVQIGTHHIIFRRNDIFKNYGTGIGIYGSGTYSSNNAYVYHNTCYDNGTYEDYGGDTTMGYGITLTENTSDPTFIDVMMFNNILYNNWRDGVGYRANADEGDHTESNNWETSDGDPQFVDPENGDFTLQQWSQCINNGGWLTTATNSGSSSTNLTVGDANFFYPGWWSAAVAADYIQFEGQESTYQISSISGNTITLASAATWSSGDGVALAYSGTKPDQGAHEYTGSTPGGEGTQSTNTMIFGSNF